MTDSVWFRVGSAAGFLVLTGWAAAWSLSPSHEELVAEGRELFMHEWQVNDPLSPDGDGLGPVFNEKSCIACHFQGGVGGGGGSEKNVAAFDVLPNRNDPNMQSGVIHTSATNPAVQESQEVVRRLYPAIPDSTRIVGGCTVTVVGFDPVVVRSINTPALFGVGLIDEISSSSIKSARRGREMTRLKEEFGLNFETTRAGRLRTHGFGSAGKFGWRGQFATLEEFVATACAVELGLTNSIRAQDIPLEHRPDDSAAYDMTNSQLEALVTYCRNLPRPEQILPADPELRKMAIRGKRVFETIGCSDCHTPEIDNVAGVYSDFLLYSLASSEAESGYRQELEVPMPSHLPEPDEWQTPPLWGVADSAPYFHDGESATLADAIQRHKGDAKHVMQRHKQLPTKDKEALIEFLNSLRAPKTAELLAALPTD